MEVIVFFLVFLAFILACYEDIKKKEIYDYLNFSFIIFILAIAGIDSLFSNSILPLKYAGFGLLLGFALGSLLYFLGVWGGGDAKFLIGFSAATFYILPFANSTLPKLVLDYLLTNLSATASYVVMLAQNYIILINLAMIFYLLYFITKKQEEYILKNAITLLTLLILFTLGFLSTQSPLYLLIIGLLAFLLIFFGHDYLFYSAFFVKHKYLHKLKEKDIPHNNLTNKITQEESKYGLSKEQIQDIKQEKDKIIPVRIILPLSSLITLNFVLYILAILSIDQTNLEILFFLIKFLFASFIAGGVLAIILMTTYLIKNFKKTTNIFNKYEKLFFISLLSLLIYGLIFNLIISYFALLGLLYYFVKSAKLLEKLMFIKKKSLENITLGDWIIQDITVGNKTYFTKEDFKLGVTEQQLEKIKKLAKHHKQLEEIYIKDGIAFLPPLFVGFIIALLI